MTSRSTAVNSPRAPWGGSARNGTCHACRAELSDPRSRRYRYPFLACPECGPGYTVTTRLPFARVNTTFAPFEPCEECWEEFENPSSRHFGSPTVCCPDCGPGYWIEPAPPIDDAIDVVDSAVRLLRSGAILGLKDTCSFRFLVRARDEAAVTRLRRRMEQPDTAFGLMVVDVESADALVEVDDAAARLLTEAAAPQVLLPRRDDAPWLDVVGAGAGEIAVMLPRAPIHILLMEAIGEPLVVARATRRDEVAVLENERARDDLMDVADGLVLHDLDLHSGCEDSVLRLEDGSPVVLRRASGLAPRPLDLGFEVQPMVGLGATHEAAIALAESTKLRLSQPVGDLGSSRADAAFQRTLDRMLELWDCQPAWVVADPERKAFARARAAQWGAEVILVDHHHAHVAAVLAEHRIEGRALGVSLDSSGRIVDPELGAGRFLLTEDDRCRVLEHMPTFRVPGADAAPRDPWRIAVGLLYDVCGPEVAATWARRLADEATAESTLSMLSHDVGCVRVSSFGKLFDAASALLGVVRRTASAGNASHRLQLAAGAPDADFPVARQVEPADFLATWLDELLVRAVANGNLADDSRWVQRQLATWVAGRAFTLAAEHGLGIVAAGGGCFSNPWLRAGFRAASRSTGLALALNHDVPSGDAGIAVGQLWVAGHGSARAV